MSEARKALDEMGIASDCHVSSAHRTPERTGVLAREAAGRGIQVVIAGAGVAAHLAGVVAAVLCGALSFFVVLRRLAFAGSGVAHAAFGGVALATLAGLPPGFGALAAALVVAGAAARASDASGISEDAAIGVSTVAAMAVGVVALGFVKTNIDLFGLMFGNILTVAPSDLVLLAAAAAAVLAVFAAWFRPLLLASVDEDGARAAGVNVGAMRLLVLVLISVTVVVALKVVGILLVSALLVLPGATARTLFDRWPGLLFGSIAAALVMVLGGLLLSVALNVASGAAIILTGAVVFVAAFLGTRRHRD